MLVCLPFLLVVCLDDIDVMKIFLETGGLITLLVDHDVI